jgi:hypothetical protein
MVAAGLLIGVSAYCFMIGLVVVVGVILLQKRDKQKQ